MAQFDVHRNLGARRSDTPFVVLVAQLGPKVGSLADQGDRIIAAIDLVISRAWG